MALPEENKKYTYKDYLKCDESKRIEIINGKVIVMSLPPVIHQKVLMELFRQLANFLEGKSAKIFLRALGVRPFEKDGDKPEDVDTVVEPDIIVLCDKSKLDEHGCKGAPDMVIEILSPSTRRHDKADKAQSVSACGSA